MSSRVANPDKKAFQKRVDAALSDTHLATALTRALPEFSRRRGAAFASGDFQEKRRRVRDLKRDAIERLPELVEQFTHEAEAVGAVVHLAATPADANRIISEIALQHQAKLVIKSKSMVSEEIHLNHALEEHGLKVVETDLGEWIMQLAGELPSHLIAPAIHKTREQVAELFSKETGEDLPADIATLVAVARKRLRQDFVNADIGISGANAAIAETGTLMIVSNEGNGRLVTTLPPVHIALLGVEKIVPTMSDATAILDVLPRSGTGQKITSYVSFITGPSRSADIELALAVGVHGPKEVHIVLLDNGRWAAREDPALSEALHCIRCGACSNVCPPYQIVGGHVFGHIYTGPIGLIMTAMHHGLENAAGPQSLCVSCNACEMVCPAEIPIPELILEIRARAVQEFGLPRAKEMGVSRWSDPKSGQRWAGLAARAAGLVSDKDRVIRKIPLMPDATMNRTLSAPARHPLRDRIRRNGMPRSGKRLSSSQVTGLKVAYFPGCLIDRVLPDMGEAVLKVLDACGCDAQFPPDQHCCGLIALNVGDRPRGRVMAEQTIRMLEAVEADVILTNSTSCLAAIAQDYQVLFNDDGDWSERARVQAARLREFSDFIVNVAKLDPVELAADTGQTVTIHDACQSANALGLGADAREIVTGLLGYDLREMADSSVCCGFGGSFSMDYPVVSSSILAKKVHNTEETGASIVVADNPGCLMQIRGGLNARESSIRALHVAELLASRLPES
jgi:L-lactate dehydrogenase complex protein LldF